MQDTESQPNLELPSCRRIARARQYADTWHGQVVSHTRGGTTCYGRVCFQGVMHTQWFLIFWSDGTSSGHNANLLCHLCIVDEGAMALPQVPPVVVFWARAVDAPDLDCRLHPQAVVHSLSVLMGGPEWNPMLALGVHPAIMQAGVAVQDHERRSMEHVWPALEHVTSLDLMGSCFLPLSEGRYLLPQLVARGLTCFGDHPCPPRGSVHIPP